MQTHTQMDMHTCRHMQRQVPTITFWPPLGCEGSAGTRPKNGPAAAASCCGPCATETSTNTCCQELYKVRVLAVDPASVRRTIALPTSLHPLAGTAMHKAPHRASARDQQSDTNLVSLAMLRGFCDMTGNTQTSGNICRNRPNHHYQIDKLSEAWDNFSELGGEV